MKIDKPSPLIITVLLLTNFLAISAWAFPVLQGSTKPPGFLSIVVQSPIEGDKYNIGSTRIVRWKSSLPADTEVVIEILASPIYDFNPPEMVWKTTARVSDGQVKFVVGYWSHLNIFFVKVYAQSYPRISSTSSHFTIFSLPIPT
ncbi:77_t:CDS:2 [Dentiscutata erythropus]|uniref:77_t:CDS:1 n=1 Tax=Dentiscutata erythropus TaxID=1348616 RepID=A0A9N9J2I0_9GLOM|nr:77_t:CDS:2 [Dentiscutata erythropus]